MYASEIFFNSAVSASVKEGLLSLIEREQISSDILVLKPTSTNDDINGSQHASGGGTDFTYEDASESDVVGASSLGYYEYFAEYGTVYTGHYYNGSDYKFAAVVVDPPAYAATVQV